MNHNNHTTLDNEASQERESLLPGPSVTPRSAAAIALLPWYKQPLAVHFFKNAGLTLL